jgi:hypothetical protein
MGTTQSKPLAARHGMCELALTVANRSPIDVTFFTWYLVSNLILKLLHYVTRHPGS